jgi:hypothetical protein
VTARKQPCSSPVSASLALGDDPAHGRAEAVHLFSVSAPPPHPQVVYFGERSPGQAFGAAWLEGGALVGLFLESATPEQAAVAQRLAAARPVLAALPGQEGTTVQQCIAAQGLAWLEQAAADATTSAAAAL